MTRIAKAEKRVLAQGCVEGYPGCRAPPPDDATWYGDIATTNQNMHLTSKLWRDHHTKPAGGDLQHPRDFLMLSGENGHAE
jgi:hypothetical protein